MSKVLIIGNPNVGKSTLFNSLTKSSEHTGNFHGVTVDSKEKKVKCEDQEYVIVDLPGMYSLNSFSYEEEVARDILMSTDAVRLVLTDANCIRKNMYLCIQMLELDMDFKLLINNFDYYLKHGNKLNIEKLKKYLNIDIEIINAKKLKINKKLFKISKNTQKNIEKLNYLEKYIQKIKFKYNLDEKIIIRALNGIYDNLDRDQIEFIRSFYPDIIRDRYLFIDEILDGVVMVKKDFVYGFSKLDKILLNPIVMMIGFLLTFLTGVYLIFFMFGAWLSDGLGWIYDYCLVTPIMNFIVATTDNVWLIEFFQNGVFSSIGSVLGFLPQVCLLFVFLTILEDSGLISRMAYVFDDFLSKVGLNGKAVYIMLMGLGCNTMSTMASRNMGEKNLKLKTAILNPYISCMARLPIYIVIASAFFGQRSYFAVVGLYLIGIVVALIMSLILTKTILPTEKRSMILEFAPLRAIDMRHVLSVGRQNAFDMMKRIFSIVLCVGIIVWILSHTCFDLRYTEVITDSVLFTIADKISILFAPIGLNSAGVVSALVVGVMAKELIVSTMSICNNVTTNTALSLSLASANSVISFTMPSAVSFLIFTLLYIPCISNIAILRKETDKFFMWFAVVSQFTIAYIISFVAYQTLIHGVIFALVSISVVFLILFAVIFILKNLNKNKCLSCGRCRIK